MIVPLGNPRAPSAIDQRAIAPRSFRHLLIKRVKDVCRSDRILKGLDDPMGEMIDRDPDRHKQILAQPFETRDWSLGQT